MGGRSSSKVSQEPADSFVVLEMPEAVDHTTGTSTGSEEEASPPSRGVWFGASASMLAVRSPHSPAPTLVIMAPNSKLPLEYHA